MGLWTMGAHTDELITQWMPISSKTQSILTKLKLLINHNQQAQRKHQIKLNLIGSKRTTSLCMLMESAYSVLRSSLGELNKLANKHSIGI